MTCPKCGSSNVFTSVNNTFDLKDRHHGCLWWLFIGCWWIPLKWLFFTVPALIVKIIVPKKQRIVTHQHTMCVCQNCGFSGSIGQFNRSSVAHAPPAYPSTSNRTSPAHSGKADVMQKMNVPYSARSGNYQQVTFTDQSNSPDDLPFGWVAHNRDIVDQIEEELNVIRKMIHDSTDKYEKYDAYKSYFEYLKVGKEYYYNMNVLAGRYFDKYVCDSGETRNNVQKFLMLQTELNK